MLMEHQSAGQYFYSLYAILLAMAIIPLALIGVFHYLNMEPVLSENDFAWLITIVVAIFDVTFFEFLHKKNLRSTLSLVALSAKLKKYFSLTIVRFAGMTSALYILIAGFFLVRDDRLTYTFILLLVYIGLKWPTMSRVCDELKLSRNECEAFREWK